MREEHLLQHYAAASSISSPFMKASEHRQNRPHIVPRSTWRGFLPSLRNHDRGQGQGITHRSGNRGLHHGGGLPKRRAGIAVTAAECILVLCGPGDDLLAWLLTYEPVSLTFSMLSYRSDFDFRKSAFVHFWYDMALSILYISTPEAVSFR